MRSRVQAAHGDNAASHGAEFRGRKCRSYMFLCYILYDFACCECSLRTWWLHLLRVLGSVVHEESFYVACASSVSQNVLNVRNKQGLLQAEFKANVPYSYKKYSVFSTNLSLPLLIPSKLRSQRRSCTSTLVIICGTDSAIASHQSLFFLLE